MKKLFTCLLVLACCLGLAMVSAQAEAPEAITLTLGQMREVMVAKNESVYYAYTAAADGLYRFSGSSVGVTPYAARITLYDSQMEQLDSNYAAVSSFVVPMTEGSTCYLKVASSNVISYDVTVEAVETPPLTPGEKVQVNFTEGGQTAYYSYIPTADGIYRFHGASDGVSALAYWYDSKMEELDHSLYYNYSNNFDFTHVMSKGEVYYFTITSSDFSSGGGVFDIYLDQINPTVLVPGVKTSVNIAEEKEIVYLSYTPTEDGLYDYYCSGSTIMTMGCCYNSRFEKLANNTDYNFRLQYRLTKGETYYFSVQYLSYETGPVDVCLESVEIKALNMDGTSTAMIDRPGQIAYYSFTPEANGYYRFYAPEGTETKGIQYDSSFNVIRSEAGNGFSLAQDMVAGTTYYFGAAYTDDAATGSFDVSIGKAEYPTLVLGQPETFTAAQQQVYTYFNFTAEESGYYAFYTSSYNGLRLALYDADMNELNHAGSYSSSYTNMTCELEAGKPYVFGAYNYSTGNYEICLEKIEGKPLTLDQTTETTIDRAGQGAYFSYTPQEDGFFIFSITDESGYGVGEYTYCWDSQTNYKFSRRNEASDPYYKLFCFMEGGEDYCFYVSYNSNMLYHTLCAKLEQAEIPTLTLDEPATATIVESGKIAYFAYTPEEDGNYVFYAPGNEDTCGYFYDSKMNKQSEDDDGEGDGRFRLVCALKGGQKYYFGARYGLSYESSYMTGSFEVCLEQTEEHVHVWGDPAYELSLDRQTVTATRTCEDCDETETETAYVLNVFVSRPPTEDEYGELTYECDTFENPAFTQTTFTEDDISPLSEMDVLYMPEDLKVIEANAFENVTYCDAIIVPDGCETIAAGAFANCEYLYYVRLPKDCEVSPDAFEGCKGVHIYVE